VMVGEGVEENIPPPDRSWLELWWEGAGLGAGVVAETVQGWCGRCRISGGEEREASLEDSRGRLSPTPGLNAVSAVLWRSRSSVSSGVSYGPWCSPWGLTLARPPPGLCRAGSGVCRRDLRLDLSQEFEGGVSIFSGHG
jgi:hypothetical protein